MPFKNPQQRKACYAQAAQARREGREPTWDCHKFANEIFIAGRKRKIYKGARGGKYVIINGAKRYLPK